MTTTNNWRERFDAFYDFALDPFQRHACDVLDLGSDVVVSAPTGSGKTLIAEFAIERALGNGQRAFYTAPIKSLSNQKFQDLGRRFGVQRVGLLTGDHSIRPTADVVVMTTEVLRNMIYAGDALASLGMVIIDEVHFLQDAYRGPVWEEVIIQLPEVVQLACLSATVSNSAELADWISSIRRPTEAIVEHHRPVPLDTTYLIENRRDDKTHAFDVLVGGSPNPAVERFLHQQRARRTQRGREPRSRTSAALMTPDRHAVLQHLRRTKQIPAVHFIFSRRRCADAADDVARAGIRLTSEEQVVRALAVADRRAEEMSATDLALVGYDGLREQLRCGVAAHHAGMIPAFREIVEECFIEGLIHLVYATETLAVGVNMPARAVVIDSMSKYNGTSHEMLSAAQYTQLAGRAGRRGMDERGTVVTLWSPYVGFDHVAQLAASDSFGLRSAFRPTYNMSANLVRRYDRDQATQFLSLSFAQFQADRHVVALERTLGRLRAKRDAKLAAATSEYGDVGEYLRSLAPSSDRDGGDADDHPVEAALGRLKPGDVVPIDAGTFKGPACVVATSHRSAGIVATVITASARRLKLTRTDWVGPPPVIAKVVLPGAYSPNRRGYRDDVAKRIRAATLATTTDAPRSMGPVNDPTDPVHPHPVLNDPDLARKVSAYQAANALDTTIERTARRVQRRDRALASAFDRVIGILAEFAFVDDGAWCLTPSGELLAGLFHDNDLLIARCLADGLLDGVEPASLAGLVSTFIYEHRSPGDPPPPWFPTAEVGRRWQRIISHSQRQATVEHQFGQPQHRSPDPTLFAAAFGWAAGGALADVLDQDMTGGDFIRSMRQLADLLEQVSTIAPHPTTRSNAAYAARQVARDLVVDTGRRESDDNADGDHDDSSR